MNKLTKYGEQQLTGFLHAKRGYSLKDLIISMGLTKKEWLEINNEVNLDFTELERKEVEDYYRKENIK